MSLMALVLVPGKIVERSWFTGPQHKLIGSVQIPIREIPASGLNKWWLLEKLDNKVSQWMKILILKY